MHNEQILQLPSLFWIHFNVKWPTTAVFYCLTPKISHRSLTPTFIWPTLTACSCHVMVSLGEGLRFGNSLLLHKTYVSFVHMYLSHIRHSQITIIMQVFATDSYNKKKKIEFEFCYAMTYVQMHNFTLIYYIAHLFIQ